MKEQIDLLEYMSSSFNQISDHVSEKHPERKWMYEAQKFYWNKVYRASQEGDPIVWHSVGLTPELLNAMGAVPISIEGLVAALASLKMGTTRYLDLAHKYVPEHLCAINKTGIGLTVSGDMPKPDALVYAAMPCDSARISFPLMAEHMGVPHYCVDTPFQENDRGYEYIANEIRAGIPFMEKVMQRKLDWNALSEAIEYSNQAYEFIGQIADLRKAVPCPLPGRLLALHGIILSMMGSPDLVDFLKTEHEMGKERVRIGEGHLAEEKIRIAWVSNPIFFDVGVLDWMEKEFGAIVTMDALGFRETLPIKDTLDEDTVFKGMAERWLRVPMVHDLSGPAEYWMESIGAILRDYKCNAVIFAGHVGCKHSWAVGKLVKDMVTDKFGIPILVFDVDSIDPRYSSPETIRARIKDLMELIL